MSKHPFAPGDVVVCVDAANLHPFDNPKAIRTGRIYRVSGLSRDGGVIPDGIQNWCGLGFRTSRFRHISDENDAETIARIKACKAPSDRSKVSA